MTLHDAGLLVGLGLVCWGMWVLLFGGKQDA